MKAPALRIGQIAQASGLSVKTVRFYSDEGLIHAVGRSPGGYRLFDPSVVAELMTMKAELAQLLSSWQDCGGIKHA